MTKGQVPGWLLIILPIVSGVIVGLAVAMFNRKEQNMQKSTLHQWLIGTLGITVTRDNIIGHYRIDPHAEKLLL